MTKALFVTLFVSALVGCANTPSTSTPTHRWSSAAADEVQYRNDHARCQAQTSLGDQKAFDANSAAFDSYKACMTTKGYELTAYTGHE